VHSRIKEGDRETHSSLRRHHYHKQGRGLARDLHRPPHQLRRSRRAHFPDIPLSSRKSKSSAAGNVRRAKLYYLRKRVGKTATKVQEA